MTNTVFYCNIDHWSDPVARTVVLHKHHLLTNFGGMQKVEEINEEWFSLREDATDPALENPLSPGANPASRRSSADLASEQKKVRPTHRRRNALNQTSFDVLLAKAEKEVCGCNYSASSRDVTRGD